MINRRKTDAVPRGMFESFSKTVAFHYLTCCAINVATNGSWLYRRDRRLRSFHDGFIDSLFLMIQIAQTESPADVGPQPIHVGVHVYQRQIATLELARSCVLIG